MMRPDHFTLSGQKLYFQFMNSNWYSRLFLPAIAIILVINLNSCDKDNDPPPEPPPPIDTLGVGWTKTQINGAAGFVDIFFVNNNVGWVCGKNLYKSVDGGINWNKQQVLDDTSGFGNMFFLNDQLGWLVANSIFRTKDGGTSWKKISITGESQLYDVQFLNPRLGYLVGQQGLYRSIDTGNNWTKVVSNFNPSNGFFFLDSLTGWALTFNQSGSTVNAGSSFTVNSSPTGNFYAVQFVDLQHGWAAGSDGVIRTTNGGTSWTKLFNGAYGSDIHFFNKDEGFISNINRVYKTTNGGQTVTQVAFVADELGIVEMHFTDPNHGWAAGWNNIILRYVQ
jgi:photosystem II stability/assembly factor-like uncharacterized protein